jgi:hypothetical protein
LVNLVEGLVGDEEVAKLEKSIQTDLGEVEMAWRRYQATHGYLVAVHNVVRKWKRERRAWKSAALA